jgi:hypothetical protein
MDEQNRGACREDERPADRADALMTPARRDAHHDDPGLRNGSDKPVGARKDGRRVHRYKALDGERRVGEQTTRVAPAAALIGASADQS